MIILIRSLLLMCFIFITGNIPVYSDWQRTSYSYPTINEYNEGYMDNYEVYWISQKQTNESSYSAFTVSYAESLLEYHGPYQFRTTISNSTFDETYTWNGGNPPTQPWSWSGTASHDLEGRADNTGGQVDQSYSTGFAQLCVDVPPGNIGSYNNGEAWAKVNDGQVCASNNYTGLTCSWTSGTTSSCIGCTGYCSASGNTTGSGPYHRKGTITKIESLAMIRGDYTWSSAVQSISFGL